MSVNLFPTASQEIRLNVLKWYDDYQRTLPWRARKGQIPNPYYVYLSEIMLQQTTVATVRDYFERFIKKWPTLNELANASLDEVLVEWQGLGYYTRARNLHAAVRKLNELDSIPSDPRVLKQFPGVGEYTSAAVASIAFDYPIVPIDGNIARIFARLFALATTGSFLKKDVFLHTSRMADGTRAGDFAQGLMDLGAMICRPVNPKCSECPLKTVCQAYLQEKVANFPFPKIKFEKPKRYGCAYILLNQGKILLERRPSKGLLGGMMGVPTTAWENEISDENKIFKFEDTLDWCQLTESVRHTFTHFHLYLTIKIAFTDKFFEGEWFHLDNLQDVALPTLMKKVIKKIPKEILGKFQKEI